MTDVGVGRQVSRQRRYQLRHKAVGLCTECPAPAEHAGMCARHYKRFATLTRERMRRAYHLKPHYDGPPRRQKPT